jgi:hypothetical protein
VLDEPDDAVACSDEAAVSVVATTVEKFELAASPRSRGHSDSLASDIVQRLPVLLRRGNVEPDGDSDDDCAPRATSSLAAAVLCACAFLGVGVPSGALALGRKLPRLRWQFAFCSIRAGSRSFADAGKAMIARQRISRVIAASAADATKTKLLGPAGLVQDFLQTLFASASSSYAHDASALQVIRSRLRLLMDSIARKRQSTAAFAAALSLEQRLLDVRARARARAACVRHAILIICPAAAPSQRAQAAPNAHLRAMFLQGMTGPDTRYEFDQWTPDACSASSRLQLMAAAERLVVTLVRGVLEQRNALKRKDSWIDAEWWPSAARTPMTDRARVLEASFLMMDQLMSATGASLVAELDICGWLEPMLVQGASFSDMEGSVDAQFTRAAAFDLLVSMVGKCMLPGWGSSQAALDYRGSIVGVVSRLLNMSLWPAAGAELSGSVARHAAGGGGAAGHGAAAWQVLGGDSFVPLPAGHSAASKLSYHMTARHMSVPRTCTIQLIVVPIIDDDASPFWLFTQGLPASTEEVCPYEWYGVRLGRGSIVSIELRSRNGKHAAAYGPAPLTVGRLCSISITLERNLIVVSVDGALGAPCALPDDFWNCDGWATITRTVESEHPYAHNADTVDVVAIPNARSLKVTFDPLCATELEADYLTLHRDIGGAGSDEGVHASWHAPMALPASCMHHRVVCVCRDDVQRPRSRRGC